MSAERITNMTSLTSDLDPIPFVELNDGNKIPQLGLGTWQASDDEARNAVFEAINIGYRHIDTAWIYGNEDACGKAIREHIDNKTVKREDLFITTKLWSTFHDPSRVRNGLQQSLKQLGLDYVDLYLIHTPMALQWVKDGKDNFPKDAQGHGLFDKSDHPAIWRELEKARDDGLVRSIGVSNFDEQQVTNLLDHCGVKPVTNQIECNVYRPQHEMREFLRKNGDIKLTAYAPLGSRNNKFRKSDEKVVLDDPVIAELAAKLHCSPSQICLHYLVELGDIVIPKSSQADHIGHNMQCFNVKFDSFDHQNLLLLQAARSGGPQFHFEEWAGSPDFPKFT